MLWVQPFVVADMLGSSYRTKVRVHINLIIVNGRNCSMTCWN